MTESALADRIRHELPHLAPAEVDDLVRAVERIVEALQPERVYVFGSQARGESTSQSDVDLLVVVPRYDDLPHRLDQRAYRAIGRHLMALDIMVMTREEFDRRARASASLPAMVSREGRVLYAAAA